MKYLKRIGVTELKNLEVKETSGGMTIVRVEPIIEPLNPVLDLIKSFYKG